MAASTSSMPPRELINTWLSALQAMLASAPHASSCRVKLAAWLRMAVNTSSMPPSVPTSICELDTLTMMLPSA